MDNCEKQGNNSVIELRGVGLTIPGRTLIEDADATFAKGSVTALLGRNGSGKSTLLRAIAGLNSEYTGKILIDGIDNPDNRRRSRLVAFVNTSRVRIANMSCREVVALGRAPYTDWIGRLGSRDREKVDEALATVGMADFADRTLDTLSDGECQRVMIARALAQDTPAVLLDEPTSFLDLPNRYRMMELLNQLSIKQNKCIILSTHELDIALRTTHRIALIDSPRLLMLDTVDPSTLQTVTQVFGI